MGLIVRILILRRLKGVFLDQRSTLGFVARALDVEVVKMASYFEIEADEHDVRQALAFLHEIGEARHRIFRTGCMPYHNISSFQFLFHYPIRI